MATKSKGQTYPFAVIDGNQAPDQSLLADSCHRTLDAARERARRLNAADANAHYYVVDWGARRWARLRPAPEHYPDYPID